MGDATATARRNRTGTPGRGVTVTPGGRSGTWNRNDFVMWRQTNISFQMRYQLMGQATNATVRSIRMTVIVPQLRGLTRLCLTQTGR
ncbi:hypothetical protein [Amycolatopsis mediterranei]|nr:hypothetical protein [Amycolatopsis mediterranei]UZF73224.1 hypothetical protein ISP_006643 [Amycolatopsis mediterranei]